MPRPKRPSFIIELPLATTPGDERRLNIKLKAACSLYNGCLGEAKKRLARMRSSEDWQDVCAIKDKAERSSRAGEVSKAFKFTSGDLEAFATAMRNTSWIDHHLGSHDCQTTAKRAFDTVFKAAFGKMKPGETKRPKPRFKPASRFRSVEGKQDSVLLFRIKEEDDRRLGLFKWGDLRVSVILDETDAWQHEALERRTKYVRCIKRVIKGRDCFFIQVVKEGYAPVREGRTFGLGTVALDLGPSTVAVVNDTKVFWGQFCAQMEFLERELRVFQRRLDRIRRATNPWCFNADGTWKTGVRQTVFSKRYKKVSGDIAERQRRLAAYRKSLHGELANRVLAMGHIIKMEGISYKSFQKMFGKSVGKRAPGMFVSTIRRKAESAGADVVEFSTYKTRLSQYNHITKEYVKKPLSQRWTYFPDGTRVQRDIYSAWLALFVTQDTLDVSRCEKHWAAVEALLREAGSRFNQSVSVDDLSATTSVARQNASPLEALDLADSAEVLA